MPSQSDTRVLALHEIKPQYGDWTVRISTPHYDSDQPRREITTGSLNGAEARGIIISVTDPRDLRSIARILNHAADTIEAGT